MSWIRAVFETELPGAKRERWGLVMLKKDRRMTRGVRIDQYQFYDDQRVRIVVRDRTKKGRRCLKGLIIETNQWEQYVVWMEE